MGKKGPVLQILDIGALIAASNHRCEEKEVEAIVLTSLPLLQDSCLLSEVNSRGFKGLVNFFIMFSFFLFFWEIDIEDYNLLKQPHIWEKL